MLGTFLVTLDWFGTAVFAVTGALVASRKRMDIVGFMLLAAATTAGALAPSIKYVLLPNQVRGPAEHNFASNRQALVDTLSGWLAERGLR